MIPPARVGSERVKGFAERLLLRLWRLPLPQVLRRTALRVGNTRYLAGVVAVVVNQRGEVLLLRHTYKRCHPWGLPAGWLRGTEDPAAAVERELAEECGFRARILRLLRVDASPAWPQLDIVYLCAADGGSFVPSPEVSDYGWFAPQHLPDLEPRQRDILCAALEA